MLDCGCPLDLPEIHQAGCIVVDPTANPYPSDALSLAVDAIGKALKQACLVGCANADTLFDVADLNWATFPGLDTFAPRLSVQVDLTWQTLSYVVAT